MKQLLGALAGLVLMLAGHGANAGLTICNAGGPGGTVFKLFIPGGTACFVTKTFTQIAPISVTLSADSNNTYTLGEGIINNTGITWTDFHWEISEEFGNVTFGTPSNLGPFTVNAGMSTPTSLWVDGTLASGGSFSPTIVLNVAGGGPTNPGGLWAVNEFPTIATPEPGTLAILGLGLIGLGAARRRRMA